MDDILSWQEGVHATVEQIAQHAHPIESAASHRWKTMQVDRRRPGGGLTPVRTWCVFTDPRELHVADTSDIQSRIAEHIALHDPDRVLRRIAAERKILARHYSEPHPLARPRPFGRKTVDYGDLGPVCAGCSGVDDPFIHQIPWPCDNILDLASGWSHMPGYREEWTP
jgi:hypothetical protein